MAYENSKEYAEALAEVSESSKKIGTALDRYLAEHSADGKDEAPHVAPLPPNGEIQHPLAEGAAETPLEPLSAEAAKEAVQAVITKTGHSVEVEVAKPPEGSTAVAVVKTEPVKPTGGPVSKWARQKVLIDDQPFVPWGEVKERSATNPALGRLINMLTYCRPAWSSHEKRFIGKFIHTIGAVPDQFGNLWARVGKEEESRVLWSSHTDTVHSQSGFQPLNITKNGRIESLSRDCLGADCTTGVWLMLEMIMGGVKGTYVFHRAEERGGQGSRYIEKNYAAHMIKHFDYAIAFDRKALASVITHQGGRRGASQAFVDSIAPMLPGHYIADTGGTFTDTACYFELIQECTNLSVGYYDQHTEGETQDIAHALALRSALLRFDESKLVRARDMSKKEYDGHSGGSYYGNGRSYSPSGYFDRQAGKWVYYNDRAAAGEYGWAKRQPKKAKGKKSDGGVSAASNLKSVADGTTDQVKPNTTNSGFNSGWDNVKAMRKPLVLDTVRAIVYNYPTAISELLERCGFDAVGLAEKIGLKQVADEVSDDDEYYKAWSGY